MTEDIFTCSKTVVFIEKMRVLCRIGVKEKERGQAQVIVVDLSCELERPEVVEDSLCASFDYTVLEKGIREIAATKTYFLLEIFAQDIAKYCFLNGEIKQVDITLRKPNKRSDIEAFGVTRIFSHNK